jgi:hypothetical protein
VQVAAAVVALHQLGRGGVRLVQRHRRHEWLFFVWIVSLLKEERDHRKVPIPKYRDYNLTQRLVRDTDH